MCVVFNGFECMGSFFFRLDVSNSRYTAAAVDVTTTPAGAAASAAGDNDDDDGCNDDKRAHSIFMKNL